MTDDAFSKALEQQDAAIASMLNGDPDPMIDSWAASDDITLFGATGPVEKGRKPVTDAMRRVEAASPAPMPWTWSALSLPPAETWPTQSASSGAVSASRAGRDATW